MRYPCGKPARGRAGAGILIVMLVNVMSFAPVSAQVDQQRAADYMKEAAALCQHDGGRLWGVSLCGPMVFADAQTHTIATNQPAPDAPWPRALGYANAAMEWGGVRWSTFVWKIIPQDDRQARDRLLMHELFHRVQPELGLFLPKSPGTPDHLDGLEGRYWLELEWRALGRALGTEGAEQKAAIRDALTFRHERRARIPGAAERERVQEINEGLAQYTGTVVAAGSREAAVADAIDQLARAPQEETFVRTFAYPSGAAYGLLLDAWSPGWRQRIHATDDLGTLLAAAAQIDTLEDAEVAAKRYGGVALREAEQQRMAARQARIQSLRARFVEGPVLILPRGHNASFITKGVTPIPGAGTIYPQFRVTGEWGSLEADQVLMSPDGATLTVPAPNPLAGQTLSGPGWHVTLSDGWIVRPGPRKGDYRVVRAS